MENPQHGTVPQSGVGINERNQGNQRNRWKQRSWTSTMRRLQKHISMSLEVNTVKLRRSASDKVKLVGNSPTKSAKLQTKPTATAQKVSKIGVNMTKLRRSASDKVRLVGNKPTKSTTTLSSPNTVEAVTVPTAVQEASRMPAVSPTTAALRPTAADLKLLDELDTAAFYAEEVYLYFLESGHYFRFEEFKERLCRGLRAFGFDRRIVAEVTKVKVETLEAVLNAIYDLEYR